MLMDAVANMTPDLFLGIIAEVPFVDVLTTMLDANLPLTPPEWPEWAIRSRVPTTIAPSTPIRPTIMSLHNRTRISWRSPKKGGARLCICAQDRRPRRVGLTCARVGRPRVNPTHVS